MNTQQSTHGDLSFPLSVMVPQHTLPYSSLNALKISLAFSLILTGSSKINPFAIKAPVTAPHVPSSNVPPIHPANPHAILHISALLIGYSAVSQSPINVDSEQLLKSRYSLIFSSKICLSSFISQSPCG